MEKKAMKPRKLGVVMMSAFLVVLLVLNVACGTYFNVITQFFSKGNVDRSAVSASAEKARDVVERIENEGMVLLQNNGGALPLNAAREREANVNVFGWGSTSPVYSGVGSGAGNMANVISFYEGLKEAGLKPNPDLEKFYTDSNLQSKNIDSLGSFTTDYRKLEVPMADYPAELLDGAKAYSDVALIFFNRIGGEGYYDLPMDMSGLGGKAGEHYLELSAEEQALVDAVSDMGFQKVVLVLNSSYPMELNFLEEGGVDAALWIGGPGERGMISVGNALTGKVNPSGRLVDTYARDLFSAPAVANFGDHYYDGTEYDSEDYSGNPVVAAMAYADYAEGIYVGYRYYETRWVDNATGVCDEAAYRAAVRFPFGYGLSYTTFEQKMGDLQVKDGLISVDVTVTNTGAVAGKDVAQIYYTAPYYVGGIEKSHVVLADYGKTSILEPGASETLTLSFTVEDMASYDYQTNGCYVLDRGTYRIKLMNNAHDVIDSRDYVQDSTVVYGESNPRSTDLVAATNRFDDVAGGIKYVSRADWEGTLPKEVPATRKATPEIAAALVNYAPPVDPTAEPIVIRDNGLKLADMIGLPYDDPQWDLLLEQLSVEDMTYLIGLGGFATQAIKSIDKPYSIELDGPAGIKALVNQTAYEGVSYTSGVVVAGTWNTALVEEMGDSFGTEAVAWKISGIYGPTMNIHRAPFGGRNYEFYSEDPVVSGKTAAAIVTGFNPHGVYNFIKHFALYNQCTNAQGLCTWTNEQALREIYLKAFEMCVKEADAKAVMSSYNRIGDTWTGASRPLLTDVLRNEWGFEGMVISDWGEMDYMDTDQGIHAGNDLVLNTVARNPKDTSNFGRQAMRTACHNILYTVADSVAMDYADYGPTPYWFYALIVVDVVAVALEAVLILGWNKKNKAYGQRNSAQ